MSRKTRGSENADSPRQEIETTAQTTTFRRPTQTEDFGRFLIEVAAILTKEHVRTLATGFGFKPAQIERIEESDDPGHTFVTSARDKGLISSSNISPLINGLEFCDLHGVATEVNESFSRYQHTSTPLKSEGNDDGKRRTFISELKGKYENQCSAVQPILYIRDRLCHVDKLFVEGGIKYLVTKKAMGGDEWRKLHSYKDIFKDSRLKSTRRIIEGDPGYGKSTVTLQIAYDWYNRSPGSFLDKYEILILLRLRQMRGVTSIYSAIKRFILPKDSMLTETDVKHILQNSSSVLVVLDGFDEYPDQDEEMTDISNIIKREMFQQFDVIVTTRTGCLPKYLAAQTQRVRMTGFDEKARDEYIQKVVVGNDEESAMKIKLQLKANSVLADVCQVPLFFVMFAHMSHESDLLERFNSVTHFFGYMMGCFHHHLKNKEEISDIQRLHSVKTNHKKLAKVAFKGLTRCSQDLVWEKSKIRRKLGKNCYDLYVRLGILVEEQVLDIASFSGIEAVAKPIEIKSEVRFYHNVFCEWFAAHHLVKYSTSNKVTDGNPSKLEQRWMGKRALCDILEELDPFDMQYLFRFSCGLNADVAEKIINYIKGKETAGRFAVLCVAEQEGDIGKILGTVRKLCSSKVTIQTRDTMLLQRSTIDLLTIASSSNISISEVYLNNCVGEVDLADANYLRLSSCLPVPVLTTLEELTIDEKGREITADEFLTILQYSSKCPALKVLRFFACLLPRSVAAESLSVFRTRNGEVSWNPHDMASTWYSLNLQTGLWTRLRNDKVMTEEKYQTEVICRGKWRRKLVT